jgi:hypothetical protein
LKIENTIILEVEKNTLGTANTPEKRIKDLEEIN